jgi:peroxiredoxin
MEAYRDQYATLFNKGRKVVVLGVSIDADTTLANWARESGFPNLFASDPDQTVAKLYGSADGAADTRNVFVIAPNGRIAARIMKFNVLSDDAYTELAKAVAATLPPPPTGGSH